MLILRAGLIFSPNHYFSTRDTRFLSGLLKENIPTLYTAKFAVDPHGITIYCYLDDGSEEEMQSLLTVLQENISEEMCKALRKKHMEYYEDFLWQGIHVSISSRRTNPFWYFCEYDHYAFAAWKEGPLEEFKLYRWEDR